MELTKEAIEKECDQIENVHEKIDLMNHYAFLLCKEDNSYTEELINKTLALSRKLSYKPGVAQALLYKGIHTFRGGDYAAMMDYILESEALMRSLPDGNKLGLYNVLNCKGICYFHQGDNENAASSYKEAIELSREAGDLNLLGSIYGNLSVLYDALRDNEKAFEYSREALGVLQNSTHYRLISGTLNNAAIFLCRMKRYSDALSYLDRAQELVDNHKLKLQKPKILATYSEVYQGLEEYEKAQTLLTKALGQSRANEDKFQELVCIMNFGDLYSQMERFDEAEECFINYLKLSEEYDIGTYDTNIHKSLEELYIKKRDFEKAHFHLSEHFRLEKKKFDQKMTEKVQSIETESLRQAAGRIKIISTIGRRITSNLDIERVLELIYEQVNSLMDTSAFGIAYLNRDTKQIEFAFFIEEGVRLETYYSALDDKDSLAALCIRENRDILIKNFTREYHDFLPESSDYTKSLYKGSSVRIPQSILCCPLTSSDEVTGVIIVQSYEQGAYSVSDLDSLKVLASYVAIALENARQAGLIRQQNRELSNAYEKLKKDIELSRELQLAMIPLDFPRDPMYKICGYFNFLDEVGGDLYDVYQISADKTVILILDVVGHGVSAALVTAMAKILFYNKSHPRLTCSQIVEAVNKEITPITGKSFTYFSLFFGIINSKERTLEYVNAAHPEPFLIKSGKKVIPLSSSSLFVGLKKDFPYEQQTVKLETSDRLVLYTDGFFESRGKDNKRFGEKRLLDTLLEYRSLTPEEVIKIVNSKLKRSGTAGAVEADDDKTMLIIDFN